MDKTKGLMTVDMMVKTMGYCSVVSKVRLKAVQLDPQSVLLKVAHLDSWMDVELEDFLLPLKVKMSEIDLRSLADLWEISDALELDVMSG